MMKAPTPPKEMVAVVESDVDQLLEVGWVALGSRGYHYQYLLPSFVNKNLTQSCMNSEIVKVPNVRSTYKIWSKVEKTWLR